LDDLEPAFEAIRRDGAKGLVVTQDAMFFAHIDRIISLATRARLPAIYGFPQHVEKGGLMSYGVDIPQSFRHTGYFVEKILKGASVADLPIELPTRLALVINLKAARAIGLTIPESLLFRADRLIG